MAVQHYRELVAWQKAIDFTTALYQASEAMPKTEQYGLTNQMRRAAVAVAANIAEGQGRGASRDFLYFLRIANGSRQEVETHLIIAQRLCYLPESQVTPLLEASAEIGRVLNGLMRAVKSSLATNN